MSGRRFVLDTEPPEMVRFVSDCRSDQDMIFRTFKMQLLIDSELDFLEACFSLIPG